MYGIMVYDQNGKLYGPLHIQNGPKTDPLLIAEKEWADDFCKDFNEAHDPNKYKDVPPKYRGFTAKPIEKK